MRDLEEVWIRKKNVQGRTWALSKLGLLLVFMGWSTHSAEDVCGLLCELDHCIRQTFRGEATLGSGFSFCTTVHGVISTVIKIGHLSQYSHLLTLIWWLDFLLYPRIPLPRTHGNHIYVPPISSDITWISRPVDSCLASFLTLISQRLISSPRFGLISRLGEILRH